MLAALGMAIGPAAVAKDDPSVVDKARDATVRGAKATDAALERAADNTGRWLNKAAKKTDAALDRAADKVGLTGTGPKSGSAPRPGPRPGN